MLPCCCRFAFALAPNHRHRTDQVSNQPPLRHPPTTVSPSNDLSAPATPLLAPLLSISKLHRQPNHFPVYIYEDWSMPHTAAKLKYPYYWDEHCFQSPPKDEL
ncbi:hypothetical protein ACB094_11G140800 [Castanea mollissima]